MKKNLSIAVAVDFTAASMHALDWALAMFGKGAPPEVQFLIVHAFKPTVPYTNTPTLPVMKNDELEVRLKEKLDAVLKNTPAGMNVEGVFERGTISEVMVSLTANRSIDLAVMGTQEKGVWERLTVGSNTLEAAEKLSCPVVAIPIEYQIRPMEALVLTTDLQLPTVAPGQRGWVEYFVGSGNVELTALHVISDEEQMEATTQQHKQVFEKELSGLSYTLELLSDDNVYRGIARYVEGRDPNLLMVIPRDRNFFQELFQPSLTDRIVAHGKVPVMIF
ncbi:MAG: universal stress protein [Bacteroidota bacterium]